MLVDRRDTKRYLATLLPNSTRRSWPARGEVRRRSTPLRQHRGGGSRADTRRRSPRAGRRERSRLSRREDPGRVGLDGVGGAPGVVAVFGRPRAHAAWRFDDAFLEKRHPMRGVGRSSCESVTLKAREPRRRRAPRPNRENRPPPSVECADGWTHTRSALLRTRPRSLLVGSGAPTSAAD